MKLLLRASVTPWRCYFHTMSLREIVTPNSITRWNYYFEQVSPREIVIPSKCHSVNFFYQQVSLGESVTPSKVSLSEIVTLCKYHSLEFLLWVSVATWNCYSEQYRSVKLLVRASVIPWNCYSEQVSLSEIVTQPKCHSVKVLFRVSVFCVSVIPCKFYSV